MQRQGLSVSCDDKRITVMTTREEDEEDLGGGATSTHQGSREDLVAHTRLVNVQREGDGLGTEQDRSLTRGGCPCSPSSCGKPLGLPSISAVLASCRPPLLHGYTSKYLLAGQFNHLGMTSGNITSPWHRQMGPHSQQVPEHDT